MAFFCFHVGNMSFFLLWLLLEMFLSFVFRSLTAMCVHVVFVCVYFA